jgi:hypothetical protein
MPKPTLEVPADLMVKSPLTGELIPARLLEQHNAEANARIGRARAAEIEAQRYSFAASAPKLPPNMVRVGGEFFTVVQPGERPPTDSAMAGQPRLIRPSGELLDYQTALDEYQVAARAAAVRGAASTGGAQ